MKFLDSHNKKTVITAILVSLVTLLVYLPALQNGFVNWDDNQYVYKNPDIQSIDFAFIKWAIAFHAANWHPLTWLSHAVDYQLWGLNPQGHHLTNIIIHSINTFLVVLLVFKLLARWKERERKKTRSFALDMIPAAITGILFGIHPVHVESVAWVSERKDLLCAFFFLLTIIQYLNYTSANIGERWKHYMLCMLFFILALMSKPMAVTIPLVLLIIDIYPLERLHIKSIFSLNRNIMLEKIPFLGFSLLSSVLTILAQKSGETLAPMLYNSPVNRLLIAIKALCLYLYNMVWPTNLVPLYPYPREISFFTFEYTASIILVFIIIFSCIYYREKLKIWPAIWTYYLVTLLPVLGLIKVGDLSAADRYTYLPSLGPFLMFAICITSLYERGFHETARFRFQKIILPGLLIPIVILLSFLTIKQIKVWKDPFSLWNTVAESSPNVHIVYENLAEAYVEKGDHRSAVENYNRSIEINPYISVNYYSRGLSYGNLGLHLKAIENFNKAVRLDPANPLFYNGLGIAYGMTGKNRNAINYLNIAVNLDPSFPDAYYSRGVVYRRIPGESLRSLRDIQTAARLGHKKAQEYLKTKQ